MVSSISCFTSIIPNKEEEYYSHKMDMTTKKNFGKDHMEALDYVGFFEKE